MVLFGTFLHLAKDDDFDDDDFDDDDDDDDHDDVVLTHATTRERGSHGNHIGLTHICFCIGK